MLIAGDVFMKGPQPDLQIYTNVAAKILGRKAIEKITQLCAITDWLSQISTHSI